MGELLASRRAGRKLGLVVALLIAPALALWLIYFQEARGTIKVLEREQAGLSLAQQLAQLYYGDAKTVSDTRRSAIAAAEDKLEIADGARFSAAFPPETEMTDTVAQTAAGFANRRDRFLAYKSQLDAAMSASNLAMEPDDESAFLIQAVFLDLPELARDHVATIDYMSEKISDGWLHESEFRDIMRSVGKLEITRDRFMHRMTPGLSRIKTTTNLNGMHLLIAKVNRNVDEIGKLIADASAANGYVAMTGYLRQSRGGNEMLPIAAHITSLSSAHIEQRLAGRHTALSNKFYLLTAAGAAFAFAGIGLAIYLFRRTLSQLDTVEAAKRESDIMANQLATMNADMSALNQDLAQKMRALADAQDEVLKKGRMEQLGQLTATVAHELRNPLGAVRTSAFLLQRKLKSLNIDADTQFERINNGITRCDSTITQLLDFSRTKRIAAKCGRMDDWLARCAEDVLQQLPLDVQIECVLGLGDHEIAYDPARLERAVVNLITNASEAMVGKGKDRKIDGSKTHIISLQTERRDGWVTISVSDNGPGIPPEHLERIREPLFTTKNFGTGLGVPAVEQIAAQHDGKLTIESELGKGACFTIWLPDRAVISEAA